MIDVSVPDTWQALQTRVAAILSEAGLTTSVEKNISTVRGEVNVDVWAHDEKATPTQTYLIECKHWIRPVPQTVVHAFRSVVGDSGANWGAIVAANGFQAGARKAAEYSNVRLLTWSEFENLFTERWMENHFFPTVASLTDPLIEYTEPINSRIFRKADVLPVDRSEEFRRLRNVYADLGSFCLFARARAMRAMKLVLDSELPTAAFPLPLRIPNDWRSDASITISKSVLDATSYRGLLDALISEATRAISEFDTLFGERA